MKLTVKWTKDFSFTQSVRRGTQRRRRHAAAYSGARFMRAMRVIYYRLGSAIKNLGLFSKSHGDLRIEKMDF